MNKEKFYIVLIVILLSAILAGCNSGKNSVSLAEESQEITSTIEETSGDIFVYVTGAVKNPGVYCVGADSRIYQVLEQAGGMTKNAQTDYLNLADKVYDGQKIQVMTKKEFKQQNNVSSESTKAEENVSDNSGGEASQEGKVNINSATALQLTSLPGIGTVKAEAIVAYREENGSFSSIEDIKNVSGIGDATFTNIESMITVN